MESWLTFHSRRIIITMAHNTQPLNVEITKIIIIYIVGRRKKEEKIKFTQTFDEN